jgi:hypothetical protein
MYVGYTPSRLYIRISAWGRGHAELPRKTLPRTPVNRGKRKAENEPALLSYGTVATRKGSFVPAD